MSDEILAELMKSIGNETINIVLNPFNKVYTTSIIPQNLLEKPEDINESQFEFRNCLGAKGASFAFNIVAKRYEPTIHLFHRL